MAAIDVGSNTVRLLIAERPPGPPTFRTIFEDRRITRLGEKVGSTGRIQDEAVQRTLAALQSFRKSVDEYAVENLVCTGTSALREAENGRDTAAYLTRRTGIEIEILSGEEEARRTLLGVEQAMGRLAEALIVVDIGGGSTEFIRRDGDRPPVFISIPVGVVKLTERHPSSDSLGPGAMRAMFESIEAALRPVRPVLESGGRPEIVATAGTPTTLAAIELGMTAYDPDRIQNFRMTDRQVEKWLDRLAAMSSEDRKAVPGLERGREDLIVSGAAILLTVLRWAGAAEWIVSDAGLREGLLVNWLMNHEAWRP